MTGYNTRNVRHAWFGGREYCIVRDGSERLVWSFCGRSRVHAERGHAA